MRCAYEPCSETIETSNSRARFCCRRCKELAKQKRDRAKLPHIRQVVECGTHSGYVTHRRRGQLACAPCRAASAAYHRLPHREPARRAAVERRQARVAARPRQRYERFDIFERDEWRCGICSRKVDPDLLYPDLQCATIDHVVPIARGGADTTDNVQLAHLGCNLIKSDRLRAEFVLA